MGPVGLQPCVWGVLEGHIPILLCVFSRIASEVLPAAGLERADSQTRQLWRAKQSINMSVAQIWPPGSSHRTAPIPPIRLLPVRKKKENKHVREQGDNEPSPALKDPRM